MISDNVEVITRSYSADSAVRFVCNGAGEYEIEPASRETHGTDVIMHVLDEEADYLDVGKLRSILDKYCAFMSVDIFITRGSEEDAVKSLCGGGRVRALMDFKSSFSQV